MNIVQMHFGFVHTAYKSDTIWFSNPIFRTDCPHSSTNPLNQTVVYKTSSYHK